MKDFKKMIPAIPTPPNPPNRPDVPNKPDGDNSDNKSIPVDFSKFASNSKVQKTIKEVINRIKSSSSSGMDMEKIVEDFPIDQYRDEDGNISCPLSKEERQKYIDFIK